MYMYTYTNSDLRLCHICIINTNTDSKPNWPCISLHLPGNNLENTWNFLSPEKWEPCDITNSFNRCFASIREHQGVRSMMCEKFVYWLKYLTPWVCVVNVWKGLCWPRILWILRPLDAGLWGWSRPIGTVFAVIGTICSIYAKRCQSLEFVHPVLFYIFADGFGSWIFGAEFDKLKDWYLQNLIGIVMCTEMKPNICWTLLNSWAWGVGPVSAMINAQEMLLKSWGKWVFGLTYILMSACLACDQVH